MSFTEQFPDTDYRVLDAIKKIATADRTVDDIWECPNRGEYKKLQDIVFPDCVEDSLSWGMITLDRNDSL